VEQHRGGRGGRVISHGVKPGGTNYFIMEPFTIFAAYLAVKHGPKVFEWIKDEVIKTSDGRPANFSRHASIHVPAKELPKIVTVAGRSSVGKSSLCNALIGRNIFGTGIEQGTTTQIEKHPLRDGWEIQDTPGLLDKDSYWQKVQVASLQSRVVVYVTTGQVYRREQELLEKIHAVRSQQIELLVLLNMQDSKRLTMPSSVIERELSALRAQLPFISSDRICCGSASPSDGSDPDLKNFIPALNTVLARAG
jgi:hypothetical protein